MPARKLTPAEWVKAVRTKLGDTQEAFAERVGVGRSAIAKWEIGVARPRYDSSEKIRAVAPPELRDVGLIQDETIPEEPLVSATIGSLMGAVADWALAAGVKGLTEDTEFFVAVANAFADFQRRATARLSAK